MPLKGKKPEIKPNPRIKFMISGKSGVGKTFFALDFPKPYFIDTESGAIREQYIKKLDISSGAYFGKEDGSQDFNTVLEEIKQLATVKHNYKTLVIDSFSHLYLTYASIAEETLGNDFGRDKKEANRPSRQLLRWLDNIDMNVVLICHSKDKWERKNDKPNKTDLVFSGTTFDGFDKLEYSLDFWMEIQKAGKSRIFTVKKSRIETLPEGDVFPLEFKKLADLYGADTINKETTPLVLASEDQISRFWKLIEVLNRPPEEVDKWREKLKIEKWEEATSEQISKIVTVLEDKLKEISK